MASELPIVGRNRKGNRAEIFLWAAKLLPLVIPAKAGTRERWSASRASLVRWVPAYAGMTN